MSVFYTGKGDRGKSEIDKEKIDKTCLEMEILGELDEFNSLIGAVKSLLLADHRRKILHKVQEDLFIIQANIAGFLIPKFKPPLFKKEKIKELEDLISNVEKEVKLPEGFVIPGETLSSAWLDYLRAAARRMERGLLEFSKKKKADPLITVYLNRLSSLFFAMARLENKRLGKEEKHPSYQ